MSKTKRLELRLTVEQYANLKKLAKDAKISMSEWLLSSSDLDSIGTLDDAPQLLKDIDKVVRTREEAVRTNKDVATKPVRTNVPAGQKGAKGIACEHKGKPGDYNMDRVVQVMEGRVEPKKLRLKVEKLVHTKATMTPNLAKELIEAPTKEAAKDILDVPTKSCASCDAKIKKGFLCNDCLK